MTNEEHVRAWLEIELKENFGGHFAMIPRLLILLSDGAAMPANRLPSGGEHLFRKLKRHEHGLETLLPVYAVNQPQADLQLRPTEPA